MKVESITVESITVRPEAGGIKLAFSSGFTHLMDDTETGKELVHNTYMSVEQAEDMILFVQNVLQEIKEMS